MIEEHKPTVGPAETIITFHDRVTLTSGEVRDVKFRRIAAPNVVRASVETAKSVYAHLQQMNVILTNACNLSCTYCYEQHRTDYGRFDTESLKKLYDFFVGCNDVKSKLFTFFGGEPLAQKGLILKFFEEYEDELQENFPNVSTSMVTNGLLLTPEFVEQYFSYPWVKLVVSLDTDRADLDHRELTQQQIDQILDNVALIPQEFKDSKSVCIRCTISKETAPHLREFVTRLHGLGVRSFVIHPLTMSLKSGYIEWDELQWVQLLADMTDLLSLDNILIQFSEGVGIREHSNCMVGSDMIAVDASGDYSGCYFFTNQKEALSNAILGNFFNDEVYVDRYEDFSQQYTKLFESEECKTCDLNNLCYQCPAGNLVTSGKMFRPDGMCKSVVRLFNLLQDTITKKGFFAKFGRLREALLTEGDVVLSRALLHLWHVYYTGDKLKAERLPEELPNYRKLLHVLLANPEQYFGVEVLINWTRSVEDVEPTDTFKTLYEWMASKSNKPVFVSRSLADTNLDFEVFYLTLLHFFVLNTKGRKLEASASDASALISFSSTAEAMNLYEDHE